MNSQDYYKILIEAGFVQKSQYFFQKEVEGQVTHRAYFGYPTNNSDAGIVSVYEKGKTSGCKLARNHEELQNIVNQIKS